MGWVKATTRTARNDHASKARTEGGIFWGLGGKVILDSTPVTQAEPYGEAKDPSCHKCVLVDRCDGS